MESHSQVKIVVPSEQEVRDLIENLSAVLASAANGNLAEQFGTVRQIIELLTGGEIALFQEGERKAQRGWLQGRLRVRLLSCLVEKASSCTAGDSNEGIEVVIDYREPTMAEQFADKVKGLYDQGELMKTIAAQLNITRNQAQKALACWHERHRQPIPDGRSRRSRLRKKHVRPLNHQDSAEEAAVI
jgi:hypothetical protein